MSASERFEAWALSLPVPFDLRKRSKGGYADVDTWTAWHAWQAARAEALEEAAEVCDGAASIDEIDEEWNDACASCAIKIRALKDKEPA